MYVHVLHPTIPGPINNPVGMTNEMSRIGIESSNDSIHDGDDDSNDSSHSSLAVAVIRSAQKFCSSRADYRSLQMPVVLVIIHPDRPSKRREAYLIVICISAR